MVSKGLIPGAEAAEIIADNLGKTFGGGMDELSKQTSGLESTIEDAKAEIQNAYGKGYNEERTKGLEKEKEWFEKNGKEMEYFYRTVGRTRGAADNAAAQATLDEYDKIFNGKDFWSRLRSRDPKQIDELWSEVVAAKAKGEAEFAKSEEYQNMLNAQINVVEQVGKALEPVYEALGYRMMQHFTLGIDHYSDKKEGLEKALTLSDDEIRTRMDQYLDKVEEYRKRNITTIPQPWTDMQYNDFTEGVEEAVAKRGFAFSEEQAKRYETLIGTTVTQDFGAKIDYSIKIEIDTINTVEGSAIGSVIDYIKSNTSSPSGHAYGLPYVPYNDYPAMLHEGERVLTASENRAYSQGYSGGVSVTINGMTVREEADIYRIAEEIYKEIKLAGANYADIS